jgi:hypothetical protein
MAAQEHWLHATPESYGRYQLGAGAVAGPHREWQVSSSSSGSRPLLCVASFMTADCTIIKALAETVTVIILTAQM